MRGERCGRNDCNNGDVLRGVLDACGVCSIKGGRALTLTSNHAMRA